MGVPIVRILASAWRITACLHVGAFMLAAPSVAVSAPGARAQAADIVRARNVTPRNATIPRSTAGEDTAEADKATTRRQVLDRLFADREITVEWRDQAYADEAVQTRFSKGKDAAARRRFARRLLSRSNYVIVYQTRGNRRRMSRIVVLGPSPPQEQGARQTGASSRWQALRQRRAAQRRANAARQRAIEAARRRQAIARSQRGQ
jgi:hypothetical protein